MKSPIFSKEKLLYFPQKSSIVPIFRKIPSSYISYWFNAAMQEVPLLSPCPAPPPMLSKNVGGKFKI